MIKIVIQTDADFTPLGKRRAKIAYGNRIRWYVGSRIYRTLKPTQENLNLSVEWMKAGTKKSGNNLTFLATPY